MTRAAEGHGRRNMRIQAANTRLRAVLPLLLPTRVAAPHSSLNVP
jgi:hypothetical protein